MNTRPPRRAGPSPPISARRHKTPACLRRKASRFTGRPWKRRRSTASSSTRPGHWSGSNRRHSGQWIVEIGQWAVVARRSLLNNDRRPLSTIHYPLSTIHYPLSTIHYPLSTIHYPLSTIHYPLKILWRDVICHDQFSIARIEAFVEILQEHFHPLQQRDRHVILLPRGVGVAHVEHGPDEHALVVYGQLLDVFGEAVEDRAVEEVLLDVRRVEGRHRQPVLSQVIADGGQRLGPAEVSDDGYDQVLLLHGADEVVIIRAGQEIAGLPVQVGLKRQVLERRKVTAVIARVEAESYVEAVLAEALVDVFQALAVAVRERELEIFLNGLLDLRKIGRVSLIGCGYLSKERHQVGGRRVRRGAALFRKWFAK